MLDDLEDLESMQRRLRDEARKRRQDELQRRREGRERRRAPQQRRRSSDASSSDGSHDLLLESSPSPSPSPSPPPAVAASTAASVASVSKEASSNGNNDEDRKVSSSCMTFTGNSRSDSLQQQQDQSKEKERKLNWNSSDSSDSDVGLTNLSQRLAERKRKQQKMSQSQAKNSQQSKSTSSANNAKAVHNYSHLWCNDDDSSDEDDIRQKILASRRRAAAAAAAEKRKRDEECNNIDSVPSTNKEVVVCSNNNETGQEATLASQEEGSAVDCTHGNSTAATKKFDHKSEHTSREVSLQADGESDNAIGPMDARQISNTTSSAIQIAKSSNRRADDDENDAVSSTHLQVEASFVSKQPAGIELNLRASSESIKQSEKSPKSCIDPQQQNEYITQKVDRQQNNSACKVQLLESSKGSGPSSNSVAVAATTTQPNLQSQQKPPPQLPVDNATTDPIIGKEVRAKSNVNWSIHKQCLLVRTIGSCTPRTKVAGFDLDQTLVLWKCAGWPSRPEHYELWNSTLIQKLRHLHDDEGYKLVIFSNQGGIKNAFHGKKSDTVKNIINWIAQLIGRPLYAVCSTKSAGGYHKGNPGMWDIMVDYCNCGSVVNKEESFFVGDADGKGDDKADPKRQQHQQSGTDKLFANNVGIKFYTPDEYFGSSNAERRRLEAATAEEAPPPPLNREAILARTALLGSYMNGPILLILVGVQGSGKTTFCQSLIDKGGDGVWCQFSQDTIKDGRPGTRQAVENAAREAIKRGKNVVVDRMHLNTEQRSHFLQLGKQLQVPVHALVMLASREDIEDRVKLRVNHPVKGDNGAKIAVASLSKLQYPKYEEGFVLISYTRQLDGRLWSAYQQVDREESSRPVCIPKTIRLHNGGNMEFPTITLGTMNISKSATKAVVNQAITMGLNSIDTAPTYNNESEVGCALKGRKSNMRITIKVPKRATSPSEVRKEVTKSLSLLQVKQVTLILLHWPCDFIEADTLQSVWKEMESFKKEGICQYIGVSNFSIRALQKLLSSCDIKPALNQVERHPLLPQWDLVEYCQSQDIIVQAHTPLGHGSDLLLGNDTILRVARERGMSPAQVLLMWNLQHNIAVVTKFSSEHHGQEIVELLQDDKSKVLLPKQMKSIDEMGLSNDEQHRFIAPPFMFRRGAAYSWGDDLPNSRN